MKHPLWFAVALLWGGAAWAADALETGFETPPDSAKPRTWWHWTMSNVSHAGITKDLEWMKRAGLGGFQLADVAFGRGQSVEPKTPFGTPEWFAAVRHAASEADRLGLEMAIFSSPGWSETGGPWVKPAEAMKKYVWSEVTVRGPQTFSAALPQPPANIGQIRNTGASYYGHNDDEPSFYADSAVVAYRTPAGEVGSSPQPAAVHSHTGTIDAAALLDDDLGTILKIAAPSEGGAAWIQYDYAEPVTVQAVTLGGQGGSGRGIPVGRVLASEDGETYRVLVTLPGAQLYRQGMVRTFAFAPVTARSFRFELTGAPLGPAQTMAESAPQPAAEYVLSEAKFHSGARVHRWEEKAGFSFLFEYDTQPTPEPAKGAAVALPDVVDLTSQFRPDGSLDWEVPEGEWTILRLGYSLTGAKNRPATAEGSGFEADKLSRRHMTSYFHGYFDPIAKALGPLFGRSLRYVMMDSWEAGTNNWSDEMLVEFRERRGYDPGPYLPVLTGRVVGSAEISDRFLWDFRRTLADMWAEHHYGTMSDLLREHGIGIYAEAAGVSLEMPEDTLLNKSKVEIPMGEFWVNDLHPRLMYLQDIRGAASAANAYGKPIVAAESFTGGGFESPAKLKAVADYWFAQGINRIVFHTSAHQPLDTRPGNAMVGTHFHRNITWAEQAAPFVTYLARTSFMLQQGQPVVDLAYLLEEGAPSTPPIWGVGTKPSPPEGYDYAFINADVLLHRLQVADDGRLVLPDGMGYRVLVLPETDAMRPELLRKLAALVEGGAAIVGPRPRRSPSLMGYPQSDDETRQLAAALWGDLDGVSRTVRRVGRGRVVWGRTLEELLQRHGVPPDVQTSRGLDSEIVWTHRRSADADIYFVANVRDHAEQLDARFRVANRQPEVWRANDGTRVDLGYRADATHTTVRLDLRPHDAVFVVFRQPAEAPEREIAHLSSRVVQQIAGPWTVAFEPGLGAPEGIEVSELQPWSAHDQPGVRFYSGAAEYSTTFSLAPDIVGAGGRLLLDLGRVGDLAVVTLNDEPVGTAWTYPYEVDLTDAVRAGNNTLRVRVINQWTNRLLGDATVPEAERVLNSPITLGGRGGLPPLPESGLLGPVLLRTIETTKTSDARRGRL